MDADERQQQVGQYIGPALQGDTAAFGKVAALSPTTAIALQSHLERLGTAERAKLKDQMELTGRAAAYISSLPPEQQGPAFEGLHQQLTSAGYKINLPPKWSPALLPTLQAYGALSAEGLKYLESQPQVIGGPTGAPAGSPVSNADQQAFIQTMMPHALAVAQQTGLDPRLVLAQTALETGYGKAAPGNNYFGIKGPGQNLATQEAGPGGMYGTRASFRTYGGPGESAQDYGKLIQTDPHYAGVRAAAGQGLEAQIDAMGKSGYATDPAYASKLRQIAGGIQLPTGQLAQAGGVPVIPQGGGEGQPGASPQQPSAVPPDLQAYIQQNYPGHQMMGLKGEGLYDKNGYLLVRTPEGGRKFVPVPKAEDLLSGGPFKGAGAEVQAYNYLVSNGKMTAEQAANALGGKTVTNPEDGSIVFVPASVLGGASPGAVPGVAGTVGAPPQVAQAPSGVVPITPPKPQKMTEDQAKAATFADRMRASEKIIQETGDAALSPVSRQIENIPFSNYLQPEQYQLFEQARRDFINAVLRRESGAVISQQEFDNAEKQYFPRAGDTDAVIKQKAQNRRIAIEGMGRSGGPAYKPTDSGQQSPVDLRKKYGLE